MRSLLSKDELYVNGMQHNVLQHCQEGQIGFMPTYKFEPGTNNYESTKHRPPAWTDRVIFTQQTPAMTLTKYKRAELTISDHKPVYAHFNVKVNKVDHEARAMVEENLIAKFNAMKMNQKKQTAMTKQVKQRSIENAGAVFSDADFTSDASQAQV